MRLLLVAAALTATLASAKQYSADRYDVEIRMLGGGAIEVRETTTFHFTEGTFTWTDRRIPTAETDGIQFQEATLDGRIWNAEVREGRDLYVRWTFEPTSNARRTVGLRYIVNGAVRQTSEGDALLWKAIPGERAYRIGESTVRLLFPPGREPLSVTWRGASGAYGREGAQAVARYENLRRSRAPRFSAVFAPGSLIAAAPDWQSAQTERRALIIRGAAYGLAAGLGLLVLALLWSPRAPEMQAFPEMRAVEPPAATPPAWFTLLTERYDINSGIFMELARRGVLRVEEVSRAWWGRKYAVHRGSAPTEHGHERIYLDALFKPGESSLEATKLSTRAASAAGKVRAAVWSELEAAGLADPARRAIRKRIGFLAGFTAVLTVPVLIAAALSKGNAFLLGFLLALAAGVCIVSVALAVKASATPVWTLTGAARAAHAKGFLRHLRDLTKEPGAAAIDFEACLPYAAAAGMARGFAKACRKAGLRAEPVWFHALQGADGGDGAFLVFLTTSSAAGSHGSGGGGGAGAGGGASGAG